MFFLYIVDRLWLKTSFETKDLNIFVYLAFSFIQSFEESDYSID